LALAFGEVCTISGESVLERQFDPVLSLKAVISALGAKARQMISDDLTNLTNLWLITFGSASFGSLAQWLKTAGEKHGELHHFRGFLYP